MRVYLDNAATTALDPKVLEAMMPYLERNFGNPSSIHSYGRESRAALENARKTVAGLLNTSPSQIFFASGGTEADNTALYSSIKTLEIKHAITSKIEHHAVLHTLQHLEKKGIIQLHYVDFDSHGSLEMSSLEYLLTQYPNSIVSLMHGNNEIGNINNLEEIAAMCKTFGAIFHSDTVQTMGHYKHNLKNLKIDFIVGSAHKFHGPKGIGFLYCGEGVKINPIMFGGSQERNMRGGTENVAGIIGLAKALEISYQNIDSNQLHITSLKQKMIDGLLQIIPNITFNGTSQSINESLYHVLNVSFPFTNNSEMLLFNLDINGIAVSGGSACNSGAEVGSHVLQAVYKDDVRTAVRFSFGIENTFEEIDYVLDVLRKTCLK